MSLNSSNSSPKQRKLTDLRVIDLQQELRTFGVSYDKKELKGSLVEKLKQALIHRNLDPELHLFDASVDMKIISADENNRSYEENSSQEVGNSDLLSLEIGSEDPMVTENLVQTMATSSTSNSTITPSSTHAMNDDSRDQAHQMDTIDLTPIVDDRDTDQISLVKDQLFTCNEDENNNEKMDHGYSHTSSSPPDKNLQTNIFDEPEREMDDQYSTSSIKEMATTADNDEQTMFDSDLTEYQIPATSTEEKTSDYVNISKSSDADQTQTSSNGQPKKETNHNSNKDQCHLWVSNIAKETHASHLKDLFSKHGKVLTTKVIGSSSSQWFGYITLATSDDVEKCINALHQTEVHGKKIYVDREMYDSNLHLTTKSKTNSNSTSSKTQKSQADHKSPSKNSFKRADFVADSKDKVSSKGPSESSKKRPASISNETNKKLSTSDVQKSNRDEKTMKSHDNEPSNKRSREKSTEHRRDSSSSSHSQSSRHNSSRTDLSNEKTETSRSSHKSEVNNQLTKRSDSTSKNSSNDTKMKTFSSTSHRNRFNAKRSGPSPATFNRQRSSSIDKSRSQSSSSSSHLTSNKYDRTNEMLQKDHHRSLASNAYDTNRRGNFHNEQRLRHEKELFERKQYAQNQEEEKIKEQQRRIAEERERVKREFEILERERLEIERTRLALEKEKQDQARELEKQQRRLADEAKQRQQHIEAKLRDENLHRLAHGDSKRPRSSHHELQRGHHTNTDDNSSSQNNSSNRRYDYRSSTNPSNERERNRSVDDVDHSYYPDAKKSYTNIGHNQRETIFRVPFRDSDPSISTSGLNIDSASSIRPTNHNQRYPNASSNSHRLPDPYVNLPPRGRDMALPPTSSVSTAYERPNRALASPPNTSDSLNRRPHSRDRFDSREYIHEAERRDRSPQTSNKLRREPMDTTHWDRPKPRDTTHYGSDAHKYLTNQYISESSSQSAQQQGLWSSAPPARQLHHHPDLPVKHPYSWQQVSQPTSAQSSTSHHPSAISSSHDRSRSNLANNQRLQMLPSNQAPAPLAPSSRATATGQPHLYSHPGVAVGAVSSSQQHVSLAPPPQSLHHATAYVTQSAPPTGLVLHSSGQTRPYEPHYVVAQTLPPQRRY